MALQVLGLILGITQYSTEILESLIPGLSVCPQITLIKFLFGSIVIGGSFMASIFPSHLLLSLNNISAKLVFFPWSPYMFNEAFCHDRISLDYEMGL